MKNTLFYIFVILAAGMGCKGKTNPGAVPPVPQTRLVIENTDSSDITLWITLGATPGCLQNVGDIPYITQSYNPLAGSFTLKAHTSTDPYAPSGMGFNGNIAFGTPPLNCTTPEFPTGVNIFEFIVNNAFQGPGAEETVDISCVAGVNCYLKVYLPQDSIWNAGYVPKVDSIYNLNLNQNYGLVGVYPFGCDICTGSESPPTCTGPCQGQRQAICNVQRNATASGGIIRIQYRGAN